MREAWPETAQGEGLLSTSRRASRSPLYFRPSQPAAATVVVVQVIHEGVGAHLPLFRELAQPFLRHAAEVVHGDKKLDGERVRPHLHEPVAHRPGPLDPRQVPVSPSVEQQVAEFMRERRPPPARP